MKPVTLLTCPIAVVLALPAAAQDDAPPETAGSTWDEIEQALGGGKVWLKARYRYEFVDQDAFSNNAHASTLRTVLGYETAAFGGMSGLIEFEDVSIIGNKLFEDMGGGSRPVVADDDNTEVNQVYAQYARDDVGRARLGRQRIILDNARFVGNVGWRQNEQTFDAVSASVEAGGVDGFYAFLDNVNRITGEDSPRGDDAMASHLLNVSHQIEDVGKVSAYGYLLDYDDVDGLSSNTFGARFVGECDCDDFDLLYTAEYAHQTDAGDNPADYDESYYLVELGARRGRYTGKVAAEVLEGSGNPGEAFQTPLATGHAFNGWADLFLSTPDDGLRDVYVSAEAKLGKAKSQLVFHYFDASGGGDEYGTEWDASVTYPLRESLTVGVKAAVYDADDFATDTVKAWLWLAFSI